MRYIDRTNIDVPNNWLVLAENQNFSPLWSFFKASFEEIVNKKCWYSESSNAGSVNPIDHFRPKANNVAKLTAKNADLSKDIWSKIDSKTRTGYPFLINTFNNYRYSCDISNSLNKDPTTKKAKGKSNFFPLENGSAYGIDVATLVDETICLLDPCQENDPSLFFFKNTGFIEPHLKVIDDSWNYVKVKVSIEVYHLNYYRFVEKRSELWNLCKDHIVLADALYYKANKSEHEMNNLVFHIAQLLKKINKKSEFSAVAIDCIKFHRPNMDWLDEYFDDNLLKK